MEGDKVPARLRAVAAGTISRKITARQEGGISKRATSMQRTRRAETRSHTRERQSKLGATDEQLAECNGIWRMNGDGRTVRLSKHPRGANYVLYEATQILTARAAQTLRVVIIV